LRGEIFRDSIQIFFGGFHLSKCTPADDAQLAVGLADEPTKGVGFVAMVRISDLRDIN